MNVIEWWKQLDMRRRVYVGAGVGAIVVLTGGLGWYSLHTTYVPLFDAETGPSDTSAIVAQLDAAGADYRVDADSKRLLVPSDRRDRLREVLEKQNGSFRQPKGFEVFDNADFGMTEFSQRINYERGLEGELARTIMGLEGIRYARLHLVLPDSSLFAQDRDQPKASVTLMTAGSKPLSMPQIEGIRQLVAYGVPGLAPDRVSIHDFRGVDLVMAAGSKDALSAAIDNRMKAKESIEDYLSAKVYDVLSPLYPAGSTAVSVDVSLRMDKVSTQRDQTVPKPVLGVAHTRSAPVHEPAPAKADDAAATAAAPAAAPLPPAPSPLASVTDFGIDKLHEQVDELPGAVERITVAILVPSGAGQHLSNEEVRQLVMGAIGGNEMRGDVVTVQAASAMPSAGAQGATPGMNPPGAVEPLRADADSALRSKLLLAAAVALGGILLLGGWILGRREQVPTTRLTEAEREALLGKVRQWLQQDAAKAEGMH